MITRAVLDMAWIALVVAIAANVVVAAATQAHAAVLSALIMAMTLGVLITFSRIYESGEDHSEKE